MWALNMVATQAEQCGNMLKWYKVKFLYPFKLDPSNPRRGSNLTLPELT